MPATTNGTDERLARWLRADDNVILLYSSSCPPCQDFMKQNGAERCRRVARPKTLHVFDVKKSVGKNIVEALGVTSVPSVVTKVESDDGHAKYQIVSAFAYVANAERPKAKARTDADHQSRAGSEPSSRAAPASRRPAPPLRGTRRSSSPTRRATEAVPRTSAPPPMTTRLRTRLATAS